MRARRSGRQVVAHGAQTATLSPRVVAPEEWRERRRQRRIQLEEQPVQERAVVERGTRELPRLPLEADDEARGRALDVRHSRAKFVKVV